MAKPKWQQKIVDKLEADPMCFVSGTTTVKHVACLDPSEKKGRKVTLRLAVNYNVFHTCTKCGKSVR